MNTVPPTTATGRLQRFLVNPSQTTIGFQFLGLGLLTGCVGSALALIIRFQLAWPDEQVIRPETYLAFVTLHGTLMLFFTISPIIVSGFGTLLIPAMIGARALAHPRLNQAALWLLSAGCGLLLISTQTDSMGPGSGWTSFPPLSAVQRAAPGSGSGQQLWLWAMALYLVSFLLTSFVFAKSILTRRNRDIPFRELPLWIWTMLVSALLALISFPVMLLAIGLLLSDRLELTSFFVPGDLMIGGGLDPHSGGNPLLFQQMFWFFGHPVRYVLALPAVGIAFEILRNPSQSRPMGDLTSAGAVLLIAVTSLFSWGQHLFLSGMSGAAALAISVCATAQSAAVILLALNLMVRLPDGRGLNLTPPRLYAVALASALSIAGLGSWLLASPTTGEYLHGTQFVVGHFHTLVATVTLLAILGGTHLWFPTICHRRLNDRLGVWHFWLTVVPVFTMFGVLHVQGMAGVLRRLYDPQVYEAGQQTLKLNPLISIAALIATSGQLVFVWNLIHSARQSVSIADTADLSQRPRS